MNEGGTVAKCRAHNAWLTANQLLVHMQSYWCWRVGEAQCRAGGSRRRERQTSYNHKSTTSIKKKSAAKAARRKEGNKSE